MHWFALAYRIASAIRLRRKLLIGVSLSSGPHVFTVSPWALTYDRGVWLLVAWHGTCGDTHSWRLADIYSITTLTADAEGPNAKP